MTVVEAPPVAPAEGTGSSAEASTPPAPYDVDHRRTEPPKGRPSAGHIVVLVVLGFVVLAVAVAAVIYGVGPFMHNRDQRNLVSTLRLEIAAAVQDNQGLYKAGLPTEPPVPGGGLGILAIPAIGLQQAVVEGVTSSQTVAAPGHVPGTAGLGQPGNSAVVGRRSGYGGPFGRLADLKVGEKLVTATTEGQSVYVVRSVRTVTLITRSPSASSAVTTTTLGIRAATKATGHSADHSTKSSKAGTTETFTSLYGPSAHNQLTLVTSASGAPWNSSQAVVVVARMQGKPFPPTPQESRSPNQQGNTGTFNAVPWLVLALFALLATLVGAVALYRRATVRSAYLLTTAPLLALTVLAAEAVSHLLPAWL